MDSFPVEAGSHYFGHVLAADLPGIGVAGHLCFTSRVGSGTRYSLIYGQYGRGNIMFGNSVLANRNYAAGDTQTLGLLNGTIATVPNNGGRFYAAAGKLRWLDQAGIATSVSLESNTTVAALPAAGGSLGARAMVTDALAPAYLAPVAGGGAVVCSVFWNGAAWICG
jgi:hypothetical protein